MWRCFAFILLLLFAPAELQTAAPAPIKVEGFTHIRTVGDISEYRLDCNGLTVLLMPEHSVPVLTFMITYRVGSRNEVTGTTGATHLLEHLMFKGTEKYQRSKGTGVSQILEAAGAFYDATTWNDRTTYYENLASDHLPVVVEMTADHMRNLLLRESDRQLEMTVVRNEYERGENDPAATMIKEVYAAAFQAHPYHHETIGWRSDIEKVPIEKLREFYDTYYWPNNATISIIGDFDPVTSLELIKKFNGSIPRSPKPIPEIYTDEPPQTGPRRVTVKRPGQVPVMAIGYKIVAATHPDYPALNVLSVILAHGKNSRLYKALTDKKLTLGVSAYAGFNRDPSLELVTASLSPGASKEEVETITLSEIEKIKKDGVSEAELQAALAKMKAGVAFQRDGSYVIAGSLAENIAAGDWTTFYSLVESTMAVTTADVRRVANKYLNVDQSTTGWYLPTGEGVGAPSAAKPELSPENSGPKPKFLYDPDLPAEPTESGASSAVRETSVANLKIAPKIVRATIVTMDVLVMKTGVKDVATLRAYLPAGRAHGAGGNPVIPTLTSMMLDQGTTKHDKFEVAELLESVGATLGFSSGAQTVNVGAKCLAKDVPLVLSLIAEQLRTPAFSAEEFAKAKTQLSGSIKRSLEDTNSRARSAFHRAIYPVGHPNYSRPPEELLAAIESATLDEVKAFHAKFYGPAHMVLVAVGDVDAEQIKAQVAKNFAGWSGGTEMVSAPAVTATKSVTEQSVPMPDKTSVSLIVGQASGLRYRDPDYQALSVATAILGSGWTSRLMSTVREKEGLSYGIGSGLSNDAVTEGEWSIYGTFAPALLSKGIASTRDQLSKWYSEGVSAEEIANRKSNIIGSYKVALTTTDGLASTILGTVYCGLDPTWIDELPSRIEALTPDQINDAIKKYLNPDRMVIIKAGTIPPATSPRK